MKRPPLEVCADCQQWSERYHELVKELLAMKREGFMPQGPTQEPPKMPELDPIIREAIRDIATPGTPTARTQERIAFDMLLAGDDPSQIAARIRRGQELSV